MNAAHYQVMDSPVGPLFLATSQDGLCAVDFLAAAALEQRVAGLRQRFPEHAWAAGSCPEAVAQLEAYFAGRLGAFRLPVLLRGTPFQLAIWRAMRAIPYGQTRTYADMAAATGRGFGAARAVGAACGANPVAIVVPCHRVVGSGGSLTGFGGGLRAKRWLLRHEGALIA
jgi:methylated-DNA-[protein]-cysteine S-methyltransferase